MGSIVLSKKQVEGGLNVKLCKDKASADLYRKQLIKQYYDVVILSEGDHKLVASKLFKNWVNGEDNDGGDDINSDKSNDKHTGEDNLYPELTLRQAKDLVGDLGSNIDEDEMYDKAISWQYDEDGDEYYLSSNGKHYYLFSKVITLKGDRQSTIYTFGKKEWNKYPFSTNSLTLLRFYNIPYDKVVIENKWGYPFLKTDVGQVGVDAEDSINKELQKQFKTTKWDL
mgnify:CR=1 FL=1